jgi:hypothetical protein
MLRYGILPPLSRLSDLVFHRGAKGREIAINKIGRMGDWKYCRDGRKTLLM